MPDNPTPGRMLEEVLEVSSEICREREIDFLESLSEQRRSDGSIEVSKKQRAWLRDIWLRACDAPVERARLL